MRLKQAQGTCTLMLDRPKTKLQSSLFEPIIEYLCMKTFWQCKWVVFTSWIKSIICYYSVPIKCVDQTCFEYGLILNVELADFAARIGFQRIKIYSIL